MITGFNTDVKHGGRVFHVQTEDKGQSNPKIESLIYVGGQILDSIRFDYSEKIVDGFDEALITQLMEDQHRRVIRDIKVGKYDEGEDASLDEFLSKKTLDEVVLAYLNNSGAKEEMILVLEDEGQQFKSGSKVHLKLSAMSRNGNDPVPRVKVMVKILSIQQEPTLVTEGYTDGSGVFETAFSIPELPAGTFTLNIEGEHGDYEPADIKYLIRTS
ncbi:MAG: hypothetical protein DRJ08_02140 [Acidobacteria bacterium]|nr:MAG: hypothetical protein DRJ14_03400 [Acidobacteriota bacterium]RLE23678.1 MAG: hypothetical protein DRJ08_02140 [Acidobacteriota bacterium]